MNPNGNTTIDNCVKAREAAAQARVAIARRTAPVLVIAPGDSCWIGKEIAATVVQVCIRPGKGEQLGVQYQIVWWDGNTRKCEWLEEHEVEPISPNGPFARIGFVQGAN